MFLVFSSKEVFFVHGYVTLPGGHLILLANGQLELVDVAPLISMHIYCWLERLQSFLKIVNATHICARV